MTAELISSGALVEQAKIFDGQTVMYRGEVIGEVMPRGDHAWLNVNDDGYRQGSRQLSGYNSGMGLWCRAEDAKQIKTAGDYSHHGAQIEAEGVFHRACAQHGGDMDIHVQQMTLVKAGEKIDHPVEIWKIPPIVVLLLVVVVLLLILKKRNSP